MSILDFLIPNHGWPHLNPFPDKDRESKTWLSAETGPITSLEQLLAGANYFGLARSEAETTAANIARKLADWRKIAMSPEVGLQKAQLAELEPTFEHRETHKALALAY